jgi:glycerol-3-phosphate dehydrogenase (NAD(P)+)
MMHSPFQPSRRLPRPLPYDRLAVVGAGSWGTALAIVAAHAGRRVGLLGRNADEAAQMTRARENARYLPGIPLPDLLDVTADPAAALAPAEAVLIVTPSRVLRETAARLRPHLPEGLPLVLCCKGIEAESGLLLSEVLTEALPGHPVGALSGPTFARETALGHPTAATIAFPHAPREFVHPEESPAARLAVSFGSDGFRPYISDDLTGVEIGGAVKNVIALACGMMTGAGYAENTRAALISRGMDEMKRLAEALGGRRETVTGLSGAGDLTLTCSSTTSRNMKLGLQLGEGLPRAECFDGQPVVVEGEVNAVSVVDLARRIGLSLPICEAVHAILTDGADLRATFAALWASPLEAEPRGYDLMLHHPAAQPDPTR